MARVYGEELGGRVQICEGFSPLLIICGFEVYVSRLKELRVNSSASTLLEVVFLGEKAIVRLGK